MVDPILISIAGTLATRATGTLFDLVKSTFSRHPKAAAALDAAADEDPDSTPVLALAERLAQVEEAEPEFKKQLRTEWANTTTQTADHGSVTNSITGNVSGNVVQARDISGGVSF
jgi:ABC-type transporter Mla subunit MlaD